jgi:hypothetical protein
LTLLDKWAQEHPSDAVDKYGPGAPASPTTDAGATESSRAFARTAEAEQEWAPMGVTPTARFVREPSSSGSESKRDQSKSVSILASPGAAQAASHPNKKHITDTLVRMGYFDDLQNNEFLLRDPLGNKVMGRRNMVAKHIKSKADAEEAMLFLCREGKVHEISMGLF